ncbi:response regulator [Massilia aerilata]|uniref:Response regulator n=1 Tax=Massilia aerilata TaxID=453817 RepID=A0ABW0RZY8_9BURK
MIRTLMAEANPVARLGMRSILGTHADALEIDEAGSLDELLGKLRERYYEFIIVEPAMCGAGAALVGRLRELSPWSDILVFTALDELSFGVDAIRSGARGYLMKTATRDELRTAVKRVTGGKLYLSKALAAEFERGARKYDARNKPHENLSKREFQVFSLAVCGMTPIESAHILEVSTETVGAFRDSVLARLGLATPRELAGYATEQGLLRECRTTCSALWSGRYGQHGAEPATRRIPATV